MTAAPQPVRPAALLLTRPALLLTEVRGLHSRALSAGTAALSLATLALANRLVFGGSGGFAGLIAGMTATALLTGTLGAAYLAVVHLLGERHAPESRLSDLVAFAGFTLLPLLLSLPLAIIALALPHGTVLYPAGVSILWLLTLLEIASGIRLQYRVSRLRAVFLLAAPALFYLLILPVAALILTLASL